MVYVPVQCQHCHSTEVIKAGKQANGTQRYRCQNEQCARRIFECIKKSGSGSQQSSFLYLKIWVPMAERSS